MKTAPQRMLEYLHKGVAVGTDNAWCRKLGTNQVPDIARKLRNKGHDIESIKKRIKHNGATKIVVEYSLSQPSAA